MSAKLKEDSVYSTAQQLDIKEQLGNAFEKMSELGTAEKLAAFPKYITRQDMSLFLARYEIFKKVMPIKGSIIEAGVYHGGGLFAYAQLSAALEPVNYNRKIIGFDTFEGNTGASEKDKKANSSQNIKQPSYAADTQTELQELAALHSENSFLSHIPKIELVKGDLCRTASAYIEENPHLLVSLLVLSVNLYEPTRAALNVFLPRMGKGSIVAIHTLNEGVYPGATTALLEECDIKANRIESFPYCPNLSYIVL